MEDNLHKAAIPKLFDFGRQNRKFQTEPEELLWSFVRNRKLDGYKFRRQHPIADFIVDFYCAERSLVIEIDGSYHLDHQKEYETVENSYGRNLASKSFDLRTGRYWGMWSQS